MKLIKDAIIEASEKVWLKVCKKRSRTTKREKKNQSQNTKMAWLAGYAMKAWKKHREECTGTLTEREGLKYISSEKDKIVFIFISPTDERDKIEKEAAKQVANIRRQENKRRKKLNPLCHLWVNSKGCLFHQRHL